MEFIITCPHCSDYIIIEQINCGIFRHGVFISNNTQIDPHADKKTCDSYINKNKIYGCGKPYQVIKEGDKYKVAICEYI
jgi:hypothetical protein